MSQDQHYVPKAYLKRFLNDSRKVYCLLNQALNPPTQIEEFSPKGTGYLPNFYEIRDRKQLLKRGLEDVNHIEKHLAAHQDNQCGKLLDRLINCNGSLSIDEASESILLILSFKCRNPVLREEFKDKKLARLTHEYRFNQLATGLRQLRASEEGVIGEDRLEQILSNVKAKLDQQLEHPDFATNIHTEQLLDFFDTSTTVVHEVANELLKAKWNLYKTSAPAPFISSDNPGFTVDQVDNVHNLGFGDAKAFYFPLSSLYCLAVTDLDPAYTPEMLTKRIDAVEAMPQQVRGINVGSCWVSYKYVYSNDKSALVQAWHEVNDKDK